MNARFSIAAALFATGLAVPAFAAPAQISAPMQPGFGLHIHPFVAPSAAEIRNLLRHASHRQTKHDTAQYTIVDAPDAGEGWGQGTWLWAINASSAAVGWYVDPAGVSHGFERAADGTYTTVDVGNIDTVAFAVNDKGVVGGSYVNRKTGRCPGFLRNTKGKTKKFDTPDDGGIWPENCLIDGPLNASGTIVGGYADAGGAYHSFLRLKNGALTEFDPPGGITSTAYGINDAGEIGGDYYSSGWHGYIRAADGTFTSFDPPGSPPFTFAGFINAAGEVEGDYEDSSQVFHGFVREPDGSFVLYDAPDAGTQAGGGTGGQGGINKDGTVAGAYFGTDNNPHGYTRAKDGTFTEFDAPGSIATYPFGINDSGVTTGFFIDQYGVFHGFLRTP